MERHRWPSKRAISRSWRLVTESWWNQARPHFDCYISQIVIEEVKGGKPENAQKRLEAIQGLPFLIVTSAVTEAAKYYIDQKAMPSNDPRDAVHLALATVHGIDYLLTWNLANATKRPHLERLNRDLGLKTPIICSPPELTDGKP